MRKERIERLLDSRKRLLDELDLMDSSHWLRLKGEEEGGCGVVGFCCSEPVRGQHIYEPSHLMHNRGNGKGGGIAAVGMVPEQVGVSQEVLADHYLLHVAFLDASIRSELEARFIKEPFAVKENYKLDNVADWTKVEGLEARPPDIYRYFVRVKPEKLKAFVAENGLAQLAPRDAEDEFVNQNSFRLNQAYYASLGDQQAFVMSHGKNIMILKVVGYAEAMVQYYKLENFKAHVWIAHQRFPTRGRVWHPGGAHPFAGVNMALVHNGDFANYHSVAEHLIQRNIYPQFLTDTEVAALLFDLMHRTYQYPLEHIIEALAPTSELDFNKLPEEKKATYRAIQATHIHGSPDGPWFFIIARNLPESKRLQLLGITDTAMLRPQVFSFSDGPVQVGVISSEKQAMDATLKSLSMDHPKICPVADRYWNARGGSHTDGGAFIFNLDQNEKGAYRISCTDKFGAPVNLPTETESCDFTQDQPGQAISPEIEKQLAKALIGSSPGEAVFTTVKKLIPGLTFTDIRGIVRTLVGYAQTPAHTRNIIQALTLLNDRRYPAGTKKRSHLLHLIRSGLNELCMALPGLDENVSSAFRRIDVTTQKSLRPPATNESTLVINAEGFPPEGDASDASLLVSAYMQGWRNFITYNCAGQRYVGCGLGPETEDVVIDVYGSSGDYLGSGIDGLTITVHGNAQDQLGQIIKTGKFVVHGDVGQTFMYGAKGGQVYVLGNAAGRPLINSVGRPRVVINGTCLDFLAESFMAGDPHNNGGFVILNSIAVDDNGAIRSLKEPYPGSNLFSLASGGAIFIRDPEERVIDEQLNGGKFYPFTEKDWQLILPYLKENERLFNIKVDDLLTVGAEKKSPTAIYRKVAPA